MSLLAIDSGLDKEVDDFVERNQLPKITVD